ncbi:biotin--[acetyl-CoA-carboxylase] ligase [Candidatus Erwinia haradaeae]|uniref:Bifunctional ligase/repressor BirA, partial n=1 Tax=Candidatus Erwinia haradaeae TaxID=1922217 RepID=A0A803FTI7_9GAMM|nr:biotin--[acetyl-CoA-carboxylase] ligase [Candidatus Erwinia haradaeae]VFP88043.1 Bifunctional ligase/repressor BirA [Candidatus Erwinia haradaeae]
MSYPIIPMTFIKILSDGKLHSSNELIQQMGIRLIDIHNYIQILKEIGINILTIRGQGYCLGFSMHLLDEKIIKSDITGGRLSIIPVIDSTNQYLMNSIPKLQVGDVCIAEHQRSGYGRRSRPWFSSFGSNLYLSIYWRLKNNLVSTTGLSLIISLAIANVLRKIGASNIKVKWPNDIYLYNRKLAGVLIELKNQNSKFIEVVVGIGINLNMHDQSHEIMIKHGGIDLQSIGISVDRNVLSALVINAIRNVLTQFEQHALYSYITPKTKIYDEINCLTSLLNEELQYKRDMKQEYI